LARFIDAGHFGAYVRAMRGVYAGRLDVLVRLVRTHLSDDVEPRVPVGGMQMPLPPHREACRSARLSIGPTSRESSFSG
jgi:GntR family transcriptional regulator/MocR family aminotransferase